MPEGSARRGWAVYVAAGGAVLVLAVAAALAVVAARFDAADLARLMSAKVMERTGRELRIDGPVGYSLSLLPRLSVQDVRLQNAPWGSRPDMIRAREVVVRISLLPLLAGRVQIHGLTLVEPDVLLEVDREGKGNWQFAAPAGADERAQGDARGALRIAHATIERGAVQYRNAASGRDLSLTLERLAADATGAAASIEGKGAYNGVPLDIAALLPLDESGGKTELTIAGAGLRLHAQGTAALALREAPADLRFSAEVSDWPALARLWQTEARKLPPLRAAGRLRMSTDALALDDLEIALGKSSAQGHARLSHVDKGRAIEARLEAPVLDMSELLLPGRGDEPRKDGRIFSAEPFPLAAVSDLTGKVQVHIGRLQLRDGKSVEGVRFDAAFDRGRIALGPAQVAIEGKPLTVRAHANASSGKSLELDLALEGRGISLGALGALLNITGTPQGSPTDLDLRLAGKGDSMRALMASASGEVRIVAGPGRLRNRSVEFGADVTELIKLLNPAYAAEPYTELKCAVVRFPVRQGVARVANGIAVETSKVDIIGAGTIDFRNETLDLGFRTKAASGLGLGLGTLAELGRLRGTLANPDVEADLGNAAVTATHIGLAAITGGLSLIASGLLATRVPDHPCKLALSGDAGARAAADSRPGVVDSVLDPIKKLFGR